MKAGALQLVGGVTLLVCVVSAQGDSPEDVIRSYIHAMYAIDLAVRHPGS